MYFSVKAFNATRRRFENLDNLTELNTFVHNYVRLGFTKFVVKAYDQNGPLSVSYFSTFQDYPSSKALGSQDSYAVRIGKRPLVEA